MPSVAICGILTLSSILFFDFILRLLRQRTVRAQMPPGPSGLPLVGNAHQLTSFTWYRFTEWKEVYGPIFSLNLAGQPTIVLNDFSVTADLIDRRSALYSDRPRLIMFGEIMTRGLVFTMTRYNDRLRSMRKAASECLGPHVVQNYRSAQEMHGYMLLSHLFKSPEQWRKHVQFAQASFLFCALYGLAPRGLQKDPTIIEGIESFITEGAAAAAPGGSFVDLLPWMLHIPRWLAPWKRTGEAYYDRNTKMFMKLLNDARLKRTSAAPFHTLSVSLMDMEQDKVFSTLESAWMCGAVYTAGQETSATVVQTLILAMLLYPEKMRPARDQIDTIVGRDRLPSAADIDDLPLVHAIVQELLRWRPPVPMSLPKRCMQDDQYKGFLIPKGTMVIENVWAMNHDPQYFDNPLDFEPGRFVDSNGRLRDPIPNTHGYSHASFGAGRRICAGKDLAMQGLLITASIILWGADVSPAFDASGKPIIPSPNDLEDCGVVVRPAEFPCKIKPRDEQMQAIVNDALDEEYILDI